MKKLLNSATLFVAKWSDVLVFIPIALFLFIFNGIWIRSIDQTASVLNVEFLSILNFNILVFGAVMSCAYFIYNLFFHDFFKKGWEERVGGSKAGIIHLILWLSTLAVSFGILTKNL